MRIGFCGPSYTVRSTAVADEECINLFPQSVESQASIVPVSTYGGKQAAGLKALFGTPGLSVFTTFADGPVRGQCWTGTRLFVVSADTLYEVMADGTQTVWGTVNNDGKPVSMACNVNQLLIVSGGYAYCFTMAPGVWQKNNAYSVGALIVDGTGHIQKATAAPWVASTAYAVGQQIVDPNGNIQQAAQAQWAAEVVFAVGAEIVDGAGHIQKATAAAWGAATQYYVGQQIVDSNANIQMAEAYGWPANSTVTVGFQIIDSNGYVQKCTVSGTTGAAAPVWSKTSTTTDNGVTWLVQGRIWQASTVYAVGDLVVDTNGNLQACTTAGTSGATAPVWGTSGTTADNSVVWAYQTAYTGAWAAGTAYSVGALILDSNGNVQQCSTTGTSGTGYPAWATSGTTNDGTAVWTFLGKNAGTSGASEPAWSTYGTTQDVADGTLFWLYQAASKGAAGTSGTSQPTFSDAGGSVVDGADTLVWVDQGRGNTWVANTNYGLGQTVIDANGNVQRCTTGGVSGASAPSWATSGTTADNSVVWTYQGQAAGTSGTTEPIFNSTGNTADSGSLVWAFQAASGGLAGTSGASIPTFNDAGGTTPDGTGTLLWQDRGLRLLAISPAELAGAPIKVEYSDSYFILIFSNSNRFQMSQVLDGTTWPGLLVNEVEVFADNISSILCNHREPWIFGQLRSQPYQDTGSAEVFDVIPGTMIEKGCVATYVPCRLDNSVFWIDQDERGALSAWRSNGYTPVRISTYAVEYDLGTNSLANLQAMTSYAYVDAGHIFWVLYVPGSKWSWCYDVTEALWHKRASWNTKTGTFGAHFSWNHSAAFGMHLVGDWNSANLYQMSMANLTDAGGALIHRMRRSPTVLNEIDWVYHAQLVVDFDTGLGPQPPLKDGNGNPRPPQAVIRFSDDRGKTWSNQHVQGCGLAGQFQARAIWRRLGRSRYRVYELTLSDPIPWIVVDAYLKVGAGVTP